MPSNHTTASAIRTISPNQVVDFDDGHIPENFVGTKVQSQLVRYKSFVDERIPKVHVIDDAVPSALVDALYEVTVNNNPNNDDRLKPWGTYVTHEQLERYRNKYIGGGDDALPPSCDPQDREGLAVAAAAYFLDHALQQQQQQQQPVSSRVQTFVSPSLGNEKLHRQSHIWTTEEHSTLLHGVAIWALASTQGAHVPYHLDYAEQIRYENNLICPPFLAGTLQCTRSTEMKGGDLGVCFGGLEHYHNHGYKGAKQQQQQQQHQHLEKQTHDENLTSDIKQDLDWITVPYRYNRMIIKSGHLPHHSTCVETLLPATQKRVIVGFNVFGHDYGPQVQQAPEHSEVFRRKVALQRALLLSKKSCDGGINVKTLQANKGLSKLLVLAKRAKIKQELAQAQQELDLALDAYLLTNAMECGVTIESLMKQFGTSKDGGWPSPVDVQVHINQRIGAQEAIGDQENNGRLLQQQPGSRLCIRLQHNRATESTILKKDRMVSPLDVVLLAP
jgi:hypothetical protein